MTPSSAYPSPAGRRPNAARRLGEDLVAAGLLTADQLADALAIQGQTGSRLGRILTSKGVVHRRDVAEALARCWRLPTIDLAAERPDVWLARRFDRAVMLAQGWVPVGVRDGRVLVATVDIPDEEVVEVISAEAGGLPVDLCVTTDWDIQHAVTSCFREAIAEEASRGLHDRRPEMSARSGWRRWQLSVMAGAAAVVAGAVAAAPVPAGLVLAGIVQVTFTTAVLFKLTTALVGWRQRRRCGSRVVSATAALNDRDLPVYTVLVPVYREAEVMPSLVEAIGALDYPHDKLDVLVLLEESDPETIEACKAARPPEWIRLVVVPDGHPRTKPRACNAGLELARGEYLVIFDAEDRPEPDQLRKAVAAFQTSPDDVVCFQAKLNYYNETENPLTQLFSLEYRFWFNHMLPGLDALALPIPLGGTSNHFRTDVLRQLGGWDAYNVTEDADLGVRASIEGYRVGVLDSVTWEEACSRVRPWVRQRSRWIKGYMQTVQVHTRRPRALLDDGWRTVLGFLGLIAGTPLAFLAAPVLWLVTLATYAADAALVEDVLGGWPGRLGQLNLLVGNLSGVALHAIDGVGRSRRRVLWALAVPLYWVLHSLAAYKALWQLVRRPFHWEKTPHGISKIAAPTFRALPVTPAEAAA